MSTINWTSTLVKPLEPLPFYPCLSPLISSAPENTSFFQHPMLHFDLYLFILIFVRFRWHDLPHSDAYLHLPHLKGNPLICELYIKRNNPAGRESGFLPKNNGYPGFSHWNFFTFLREDFSQLNLAIVKRYKHKPEKAHPRAKIVVGSQWIFIGTIGNISLLH